MDNRLRLYETKSDYLNDANSLTYPTVSFIEENKSFKKKERSYLFATYKVTDTSAAILTLSYISEVMLNQTMITQWHHSLTKI